MSDLLQSPEEIHEACRAGHYAKVEELLSVNPKLAQRRDSDDRLPLHWAVSYNHLPLVTLLSQEPSFDVDARDASGWTPLMVACSIGDGADTVQLLLSRGADVNAKSYNASQTALHLTVSKMHIALARLLLGEPHKASPRVRDRLGQLPLHRAAAVGSAPLVGLLLDNGSPLNTRDTSGATPLHHAVAEGQGDAAVLLLKRGAETDVLDGEGKMAIELAPDRKVGMFILAAAREEGIEIATPPGVRAE